MLSGALNLNPRPKDAAAAAAAPVATSSVSPTRRVAPKSAESSGSNSGPAGIQFSPSLDPCVTGNLRVAPVEISLSELRGQPVETWGISLSELRGEALVVGSGIGHGGNDAVCDADELKRAVKANMASAKCAASAARDPLATEASTKSPSKRMRAVGAAAGAGEERLISKAFAVLGGGRQGARGGAASASAAAASRVCAAVTSPALSSQSGGAAADSAAAAVADPAHDCTHVSAAVDASISSEPNAAAANGGVGRGRGGRTRSLLSSALKGIGSR
jgi:hypothetical protein